MKENAVALLWKYNGERYYMKQYNEESYEDFKKRVKSFAFDLNYQLDGFYTLKEY